MFDKFVQIFNYKDLKKEDTFLRWAESFSNVFGFMKNAIEENRMAVANKECLVMLARQRSFSMMSAVGSNG